MLIWTLLVLGGTKTLQQIQACESEFCSAFAQPCNFEPATGVPLEDQQLLCGKALAYNHLCQHLLKCFSNSTLTKDPYPAECWKCRLENRLSSQLFEDYATCVTQNHCAAGLLMMALVGLLLWL